VETGARRVRRRCGWWCARRDRSAGWPERSRRSRSPPDRRPARRACSRHRCTNTLSMTHLEEQRRDQGEHLHEERRDQHLAQKVSIFVESLPEPGDVEPAGDFRQYRPGGSSGSAGPSQTARSSARVITCGPRFQWRLDQDLSSLALATTRNPPSRRAATAGKGRLRKPRPVGPVGTSLEPEILGAAEHLRDADPGRFPAGA